MSIIDDSNIMFLYNCNKKNKGVSFHLNLTSNLLAMEKKKKYKNCQFH